jgi:hypothetical protein
MPEDVSESAKGACFRTFPYKFWISFAMESILFDLVYIAGFDLLNKVRPIPNYSYYSYNFYAFPIVIMCSLLYSNIKSCNTALFCEREFFSLSFANGSSQKFFWQSVARVEFIVNSKGLAARCKSLVG